MPTYVNWIAAYPLDSLQNSIVMTCQLEIISEHRDIVGDDAIRVFREEGGSIGRSLQNDWILPDPDRYISGRHATIDFKGGIYHLVDTSSNGVYVNGDCEPVGKGNVRRLFNGDILRFGDFEITLRPAFPIDSCRLLKIHERKFSVLFDIFQSGFLRSSCLRQTVEVRF